MPEHAYTSEWWERMDAQLFSEYPNFRHNLYTRFPELSSREIKLASLILLRKEFQEVADIFGITVESAHTACWRLRKKLKAKHSESLFVLLVAFAEGDMTTEGTSQGGADSQGRKNLTTHLISSRIACKIYSASSRGVKPSSPLTVGVVYF